MEEFKDAEVEELKTGRVQSSKESQSQEVAIVTIPPKKGVEYKFHLEKHGRFAYEWSSPSPLFFDFHGEPEGDTTGFFESYTIATANKAKGTVTVPFTGIHGWYWKNSTESPVDVTLTTSGDYRVVGLK